jgi:hypothetical protein
MNEIRIDINILRLLYQRYYNPATYYRNPPEITEAWREIARIAGFDEETEHDGTE